MTTGAPIVVQKSYEFSLWLVKKVERFPRAHRFTLGDRLVARALDLHESLLHASYAQVKHEALERCGEHLNTLRHLLRLAKDLDLIGIEPYGYAAEKLEEIGRMAGGWRKSLKEQRP